MPDKDSIQRAIDRNRGALTRLGGKCPECKRPIPENEKGYLCWRCDPDWIPDDDPALD